MTAITVPAEAPRMQLYLQISTFTTVGYVAWDGCNKLCWPKHSFASISSPYQEHFAGIVHQHSYTSKAFQVRTWPKNSCFLISDSSHFVPRIAAACYKRETNLIPTESRLPIMFPGHSVRGVPSLHVLHLCETLGKSPAMAF